ncbi:hypothetical protein NEF87_004421 [Candidatus Lokiarchaeum ossiferum]|uniref:Uncharacterized protein n=1 Tax=Candidatus Lokiarchaeum ossiferum TaxID=2951803 RepID=A0ABY6HZZ3_9ARCH|nr:hypothetical protein NEF87_004421 [Candidatus Lokiarchaeum sp. B-35]
MKKKSEELRDIWLCNWEKILLKKWLKKHGLYMKIVQFLSVKNNDPVKIQFEFWFQSKNNIKFEQICKVNDYSYLEP